MRAPQSRWLALALLGAAPIGAPAADVSEVPAEAVVGTLAFLDVDEPNRIYLDLAPEGAEPFRMFLDTGASHSVMTPLAARAAGVSVRALKDTPYRRTTRLGRDLQFWVDTRRSDTGSRAGWEYGVLGGNFLREYVLELDFTKRSVRLLDPKRYGVPETAAGNEEAVLPIRESTRPITSIALGGQQLPVLLDTGCTFPVVLSGSSARKAGIDVDSLAPFGQLYTAMGATELRFYEAPSLELGGFRFAGVPILVAPNGWFGQAGEADDSVIGYDLLSRFLVRVDYPERRLWLRRQSEQVVLGGIDYGLVRASGAFLRRFESGWTVDAVRPGTPAEQLGLRVSDFIDRARPSDSPEATLRAIAAGKPLRVERNDGGTTRDVDLVPREPAPAP